MLHTYLGAFEIHVLVPFVPPGARWTNEAKVARFNHHHRALSAINTFFALLLFCVLFFRMQ